MPANSFLDAPRAYLFFNPTFLKYFDCIIYIKKNNMIFNGYFSTDIFQRIFSTDIFQRIYGYLRFIQINVFTRPNTDFFLAIVIIDYVLVITQVIFSFKRKFRNQLLFLQTTLRQAVGLIVSLRQFLQFVLLPQSPFFQLLLFCFLFYFFLFNFFCYHLRLLNGSFPFN